MLENAKKTNFTLNWDDNNNHYEKKVLPKELEESIINDKGFIYYFNNKPGNNMLSMLNSNKRNNISSNELSDSDISISPVEGVIVKGFHINESISVSRSDRTYAKVLLPNGEEKTIKLLSEKEKKEDIIVTGFNLKKKVSDNIIKRSNKDLDNLDGSNLVKSIETNEGTMYSCVDNYYNIDINMPYFLLSEWDKIREAISLLPLIILGIIFIFYKIKEMNDDNSRFYFLSVLPHLFNNINRNNNINSNNDEIIEKVIKIWDNVDIIQEAIILRKGCLTSEDVDGIKKIINMKMREEGIPERFFTNIIIHKEGGINIENLNSEDKEKITKIIFEKGKKLTEKVINEQGNTLNSIIEQKEIWLKVKHKFTYLGITKRVKIYKNK